jgi:hypothetical protein
MRFSSTLLLPWSFLIYMTWNEKIDLFFHDLLSSKHQTQTGRPQL